MGLFDKIKEILFVEEEEELPVITKKEEKKEDGRSIQDDIPSRSRNLKRDIEDNRQIKIKRKNQTIQNVLIKADIITLSIGNNDIYYKLGYNNINEMYNYIDNIIDDIERLFKLLKKYSKEKIFIIGFYNDSSKYKEIFEYLNMKVKEKCLDYEIQFIDISNLNKNCFNNNQLNKKGQKEIYKKIKKYLKY